MQCSDRDAQKRREQEGGDTSFHKIKPDRSSLEARIPQLESRYFGLLTNAPSIRETDQPFSRLFPDSAEPDSIRAIAGRPLPQSARQLVIAAMHFKNLITPSFHELPPMLFWNADEVARFPPRDAKQGVRMVRHHVSQSVYVFLKPALHSPSSRHRARRARLPSAGERSARRLPAPGQFRPDSILRSSAFSPVQP